MLTGEQRKNCDVLISALRAPMPENFEWDFTEIHVPKECGTRGCAIGLAIELGLLPEKNWFDSGRIEQVFGIPGLAQTAVFYGSTAALTRDEYETQLKRFGDLCAYPDNDGEEPILPAHVADALERILEEVDK